MFIIQQWNRPEFMYLLIILMIGMIFRVYSYIWNRCRAIIVETTLNPNAEKPNFLPYMVRAILYGVLAFAVSTAFLLLMPQKSPLTEFCFCFLLDVGFCFGLYGYLHVQMGRYHLFKPEVDKNVQEFSNRQFLSREVPRALIMVFSLGFMILAAMGPEGAEKTTKLRRTPLNVTILFDLSRSMDAQDYSPSRLRVAKDEMVKLLEQGEGDEIGLVFFSDTAIVQAPQTYDMKSLQNFIEHASTDTMPTHGTDLIKALETALRMFDENRDDEYLDSGHAKRRVVLVTDGESHSGDYFSILERYVKRGIHIDVIAIGSENGAEIPLEAGKMLMYGNVPVISRLDSSKLEKIAKMTDGTFVRYTVPELAAQTIISNWDLVRISSSSQGVVSSLYRTQLYSYFLYPAYILLILFFFHSILLWLLKPVFVLRRAKQKSNSEKEANTDSPLGGSLT